MVEEDLGEARIVYEHPEEGTVEETVENEHIAYLQDHWIINRATDEDQDHDRMRRIPANRVFFVERSVEEFAEEVTTLRDQVESFTRDIRRKLPVGGDGEGGGRRGPGEAEQGTHTIDVEKRGHESEEERRQETE